MKTINIKVVALGSQFVGKTSLLNACVDINESTRPFDHVSTMVITLNDNDLEYRLELWDTKSVESYKIIEEMKSCEFSVALICYSVMEIKTLEEAKKKWIPLVRKNSPNSHLLIIGTKIDLRDDRVSLLRLDRLQNQKPITVDEGYRFALNNNGIFHECSAFSQVRK